MTLYWHFVKGPAEIKLFSQKVVYVCLICATPFADLRILLCLKACKLRDVAAAHNIYIYGTAATVLFVSWLTTV